MSVDYYTKKDVNVKMMNKPKKKYDPKLACQPNYGDYNKGKVFGYNQCYDEFEKFLPSQFELQRKAYNFINKTEHLRGEKRLESIRLFAKAIAKRIGK